MTSSSSSCQPNLLECSPSDLASYLHSNRFSENSEATATFLLEATSTLPNAESISAELLRQSTEDDGILRMRKNNKQQEKEIEVPNGDSSHSSIVNVDKVSESIQNTTETFVAEWKDLSMMVPRGKFNCQLLESGGGVLFVSSKKDDELFRIRPHHVDIIIVFPKPEDRYKPKENSRTILFMKLVDDQSATIQGGMTHNKALAPHVVFKTKALSHVYFPIPMESSSDSSSTFLSQWCQALSVPSKKILRPGSYFRSYIEPGRNISSTTSGGLPWIRCYQGTRDGHLFPLKEGLWFASSPPLWIPRSSMASIACGRGGTSSSRYVDLLVTLDHQAKVLEFTNIPREELGGLTEYLHQVLIPAMKRDVEDGITQPTHDADSVQEKMEEEEDDVSEETETLVNVEIVDDDTCDHVALTSTGNTRRPSRKASLEAREATKAHFEATAGCDNDDDDDENDSDDANWIASKQKESEDDEEDDIDDTPDDFSDEYDNASDDESYEKSKIKRQRL
jgi:Histone chaperone Rttp106-like